MKRLYGSTVRKETGVTKTFKGVARNHSHRAPIHVKRAVQEVQGTLERVFDETSDAVEKFLSKCRQSRLESQARNMQLTRVFQLVRAFRDMSRIPKYCSKSKERGS